MARCLICFAGLAVLGNIGAFFLLVPVLSIITATLVLTGISLAFLIGVHVGSADTSEGQQAWRANESEGMGAIGGPVSSQLRRVA